MDKQQEATKPVEQKDLDKVSGGQGDVMRTQNPLPHRNPKPIHGPYPEPDLDKVSAGGGDIMYPKNPFEPKQPKPIHGRPEPC